MSSPKPLAPAMPRKPRRTAIAAALASPLPGESSVADGAQEAAPATAAALVVAASPEAGAAAGKSAAPADGAARSAAPGAGAEASKVKHKLVRDSFTIPKNEYTALTELKQRAGRLGNAVKKSELLRAGVRALAAMPDDALLSALAAIPVLKTGRPKSKRSGDSR